MSESGSVRYQFDASEVERDAYSLAHGAFAAVRGREARATYGFDIEESTARSHMTSSPQAPDDFDDALDFLRAREQRRARKYRTEDPLPGSPSAGDMDVQGERQIPYDTEAWDAMEFTAAGLGIELIGEEDRFRKRTGGPIERGQFLAQLIALDRPCAIGDPLDGSNQAAGMGMRSGWASCALVRQPGVPLLGACVLLGDGRGFVTDGRDVWLSESAHPDRSAVSRRLDPLTSGHKRFEREHFIIPASKRSTVELAARILGGDHGINWISPLGGNPGLLTGMLTAGASGGCQPEAFAWDHMSMYFLAAAGYPVVREHSDAILTADEVGALLLEDLAAGRKTGALYVGRHLTDALRVREVYETARLHTD